MKNPLKRDVNIDYDMESEDELQEMNAKDIENSVPNTSDEESDDEEDGSKFVVPDGYLSNEEVS